MSRLTRDGTAEPVSRDQILRYERGHGNIMFSCSADQEQDWQPYPVDPYSCYMCDHTWCAWCAWCAWLDWRVLSHCSTTKRDRDRDRQRVQPRDNQSLLSLLVVMILTFSELAVNPKKLQY